ncbi:hypothetical protein LZ30DRAFT_190010 [Colletotrichum cereale]|nr:hypothetical protein LZ30DRAFT_190010 [Colletotrichum cereale]
MQMVYSGWIMLVVAASIRVAATNPQPNATSLTTLLSETKACAVPCIVEGLSSGGCSLAGLADCLCPNITLRAHLSQCVQMSCSYEDQVGMCKSRIKHGKISTDALGYALASLGASQGLCRGYPIPDRQSAIRITGMVLPAISVLIVALRYTSRLAVAKKLWWDDWTALMAAVSNIVTGIICVIYSQMGFGRHFWDIDVSNGKTILQLFYITQMFYIFSLVCAKVSLSAFYCRVFMNQTFLFTNYLLISLYLVKGVLFLFLIVFQCLPIQAVWDLSIDGHCLDTSIISYSAAAVTIAEDIVLLVVPIPELLKLQLGPRKKFALIFMFGFGFFATITSIIRLKYLVLFSHTYDRTWDNYDVVVWSAIEVNVAIMCGSLPALLPLIKKISGSLSNSKTTPHNHKWYYISRKSPALPYHNNDNNNNTNNNPTHGLGVASRQIPKPHNQTEVIEMVQERHQFRI